MEKSVPVKDQKKVYGPKNFRQGDVNYRITAKVGFDDEYGNGHNTFSITGDIDRYERGQWREASGGCIHDEIAKHFPELRPYIKWHSFSVDGPYIADTLYHASDRDCWGLKKGEFNSFTYQVQVDGKSLFQSRVFYTFRNWLHRDEARDEAEVFLKFVKAEFNPEIVQVGHGAPSEGKEPDLEAARSCAAWPEATLEQLRDKEQLKARLPKLLVDFRKDMESLGFKW